MNVKDYTAGVLSTESVPESLEINEVALHALMTLMMATVDVADLVKRKLYYGKPIDEAKMKENLNIVSNVANFVNTCMKEDPGSISHRIDDFSHLELKSRDDNLSEINLDHVNVRLAHCALGMFTESGELIGAVLKQFETGVIDKVNFGEELGDADWYKTIGHDESGISEEESRARNNRKLLDKLAGRYKTGTFTATQAVNRDTDAERVLLEGKAA